MAAEAELERKVCMWAHTKLGVANFKWGVDGWPDRVFLIPGGRPLIIEFKAPGELPNPRQAFRIKCLTTWGYDVEVHDNAKRAFSSISRAMDTARLL